jgi:glycerol transport system ATP-binding protein
MDATLSLELQNIGLVADNQTYLEDINLTFESGAFNVLLGRTLAGKTSLMRVIAGLDKPTAGNVLLNGENITRCSVQKRNVSMVYQQFINYPHFSVWENIASPLKIAKVPAQEIKRRVSEIAELLHIEPFLHKQPLELSGGQQQRCAMARALVKDAQIILFDEPLVNLDYKLRETLRFELKALFKKRESIAIYATTEAHEALALGGTTALLHEGRVLQNGEALQQYYQPADLHAADLFHEPPMNRFNVSITERKLRVASSLSAQAETCSSTHAAVLIATDIELNKNDYLASLNDGIYQCAVRPDQVYLASTNLSELVITGQVDLAEISASETFVHVTLSDPALDSLTWVVHLQGMHHVDPDAKLRLFVAVKDMYVFDQQGASVCSPKLALAPKSKELS